MQLGPHALTPFRPGMPILTLAPMAGVGNWVFRLICARLGARLVGVEFINCRTIAEGSRRSERLLDFCDAQIYVQTGISLLAAQIYGNDLDLIAQGAREFERRGAQVVDINFGCSVPQLLRKGCGAAYLRDLDRLYRAVRQTVEAVQVPVMVKTRIGWDQDSINILEVVRRVEGAGARAIAIHARTVVQKYQGRADWDWIARAREVATIPVLGNGDVFSYEDALRMQQHTGCQAVMIGRAAMANPWIFAGRRGASLRERIALAVEQVRLMAQYKGERVGVLETRKHLALYFKGLPRTSQLRLRILRTEELGGLVSLLEEWGQSLAADAEADLTLSAAEAGALGWGSTG
ncbi:MAG: tRNA-dihydrouridine synthase [Candidatus Latescibacteria bacterium]|nr:tRNA-dihydrouridine synthase [Candidatus Latescibacterota bacterium]